MTLSKFSKFPKFSSVSSVSWVAPKSQNHKITKSQGVGVV